MANINELNNYLPLEWKEKISSDYAKMKAELPTIVNPEDEKKKFFVTTIIQPNLEVRTKIFETVREAIGSTKGMYLQPLEGYHFSIQWSDLVEGADVNKLTDLLRNIPITPLSTDIKLVYPSKPNLFAVVIPKNDSMWMAELREKYTAQFDSAGFTPKLPEKLPLIWMSLARFTKDFDVDSLDKLTNSLPEISIESNTHTLFLAKSDPYFTQDTSKVFFSKSF